MKINWKKKAQEYKEKYFQYGTSFKALKWRSQNAMQLRHKELLKDLDINNKSILDFGCGFGNLIKSLKLKGDNFKYLGVDIVDDFIKKAKEEYPNYNFMIRNFLEEPLPGKFDIVIASGSLNSNFENPLEFRKRAIKLLFNHCNYAFAFNMSGAHPQPKTPRNSTVYYADSLEILKYCTTLTPKIVLRNSYRSKDFTIIMLR